MNSNFKRYLKTLISVFIAIVITHAESMAQGPWTIEFNFNTANYRHFVGFVDGTSVDIAMFSTTYVINSTTGNITGSLLGSSESTVPIYYTPYTRCDYITYANGVLKFYGRLCAIVSSNCPGAGTRLSTACIVSSAANQYSWEITDDIQVATPKKYFTTIDGAIDLTASDLAGLNLNNLYARVRDVACSGAVSSWTTFKIYSPPTIFNVTGGGKYCPGGASQSVSLSGSQTDVRYQLKADGVDIGSPVTGTGSALSWTGLLTTGRYTVVATHSISGCSQLMNESAVVFLTNGPTNFIVNGGGVYCSGGEQVNVNLSGSQSNVNYQLRNNGVAVGSTVAGTNGMLTWPNQTSAGSYTVLATDLEGCATVMSESATVTVPSNSTLPALYTTSGGGNYCAASNGTQINLSSSQTGVRYELVYNVAGHQYLSNLALNGTGSALVWPNIATTSTFTIRATNVTTGCRRFMNGSAVVELATVLPDQSFLNTWAFQYKYDEKRRMIGKKVPGADWVYMVYDDLDRLVLTQDGNQRIGSTQYWTFTKYDELNRPVLTGIKDTTAGITQAQMQNAVDTYYAQMSTKTYRKYGETFKGSSTANTVHGYTNYAYPRVTTGTTLDANNYLTVKYYDNYTFRSDWPGTYVYSNDGLSATVATGTYTQPTTENTNVVGLATGGKIKVLDGGVRGGYTWLRSITYFDDKYRVTQTQVDNYKGGKDKVSNLYDFEGKILKSKETHTVTTWTNLVAAKQDGNKLIDISATQNWGTSGASSLQQLGAGQDGWLEVTASETSLYRMIGLSDQDVNANYTTIDYAFYLVIGGALQVYENGVSRGGVGQPYKGGDILRIERVGTSIKYYQNNVLVYSSTIPSSTVLLVDAALYNTNATLVNARTSFTNGARTITRIYDYDHAGRLLRTWHQIDNGTNYVLSKNDYNELGQLVDKRLHSTAADAANAKQSVDYRYNIRGWLTSMNNSQLTDDHTTTNTNDDTGDLFGMNLLYNTNDTNLGSTALYNGNISGMKWSTNLGLSDIKESGYNFNYDAMNRLVAANSKMNKTNTWQSGYYDENGLTYDLNGNIKKLLRKGDNNAQIDDLTYGYYSGGNQLQYVKDATSNTTDKIKGFTDGNAGTGTDGAGSAIDYTYDANGNLTHDLNKGIGTTTADAANIIAYNYLNLPETVTKAGNSVRYIYDASGQKLSQVVSFGATQKQTDYIGEFQYENDALQFISHEEGRIVVSGTTLIYTNSFDVVSNDVSTSGIQTPVIYSNTGEKYLQITSAGTASGTGTPQIGKLYTVQPGERYRIRAKGYSTAVPVYLQVQIGGVVINTPGAKLPNSVTTESWVEQIVTIPAGAATTMKAGLVWSNAVAGEIYYLNEFEINQLSTKSPEYQYNMKDHLGNVRLTFTATPETATDIATLETATATTEKSKFLRYDNARLVNHYLFDHTNGSSPTTVAGGAQRLSGQTNEVYGLAKSLSVMPGDVISMEVYAKYIDKTSTNRTAALNSLLTQIAAGPTGGASVVDGSTYSSSTTSFTYSGLNNTASSTGTGPKAYLNWLVYDKNFNIMTSLTGYQRLSATPRETGQDIAHEKLSNTLTIKEPGYVYIYYSNEEGANAYEVYFDDFKVTQTKSAVISSQDYYPFGLNFNSYSRENSVPNRWKFQGQEHSDDLNLGWDSFKWRNHQPDIGRFFGVDKLAERYYYNSPYAFSENKVIRHVELEGLEAIELDVAPIDVFNASLPPPELTPGQRIAGGVGNVVFGTVGLVGSIAYCSGTLGGGAALGGGVAIAFSCGEIALGFTQIVDGGSGSNSKQSEIIQQSNSLPGLVAYGTGYKDADVVDAAGAFIPGLFTGGNWTGLGSGLRKIKDGPKFTVKVMGALEAYDAGNDIYGYYKPLFIDSQAGSSTSTSTSTTTSTSNTSQSKPKYHQPWKPYGPNGNGTNNGKPLPGPTTFNLFGGRPESENLPDVPFGEIH